MIANLPNCVSKPFVGAGLLTENMFNAQSHLDRKMNCDPKLELDYRKVVSEQIIDCGKNRSDLSELMAWFSGPTVEVDATELWQRVLCKKNYNIYAGANASGAAGSTVTLKLAPISHTKNGGESYVGNGYELYHYRTNQTFTVLAAPNTSVAWAHTVSIISLENKAIEIRKGDVFFVSSSRTIGKVACSIAPSTLLRETGYLIKSSPLRLEESYAVELGADTFGQKEVYTFPLLDDNGKVHEYWELWQKAQKRLAMERAKGLKFLLGSKITNPNHPLFGDEFSGFDGYVNKVKYGGGRYQAIPLSGLTIADFDMVEAAARGYGIEEFTWIMPHAQRVAFERNMSGIFASNAGNCTFKSFTRNGMSQEDVKKLGISSYSQNGFTHHIKTAKWADYEELLGNDFLKNTIFVMPTWGAKDVEGKMVPTFEFIKPIGLKGIDQTYFEQDDDQRTRSPFCEKIEGTMRQVLWMRINCIQHHWMFEAKGDC